MKKFYKKSIIVKSFFYFLYFNYKNKINIFLRNFKKFKVKLHEIDKINNPKKKINILMFDTVHHRLNIYTDCLIVEYLQNIFQCNVTGLMNKNDKQSKSFYDAIGTKKQIVINEGKITSKFSFFKKSLKIIGQFNQNDIKNFIDLKVDDINLGRSVYDHIIRLSGIGSHYKLDSRFVFFLAEALFYKDKFDRIFVKNKFDYLVLSEVMFLPSNILIQIALKNKVKVISRIMGPKKIGIRVYNDFSERFQCNHAIKNNLFKKMIDGKLDKFSNLGYEKILNIFEKKTNNPDYFSKRTIMSQNNFNTKNELIKLFNWNKNDKVCTIFSHNMIDGNYANEWRLFIDSKTWLIETLKYIKKLDSNIRWLIRPHPSETYFPRLKTRTNDIFNEVIGYDPNIKLCPSDCAPNTIKKITNIAITSYGSVGIEYPCFGIPAIIAGDSFYTGNGFNIEPKSVEKYFEMITNIGYYIKKKLSNNQIDLARAFYFVHDYIIQENCPLMDEKFDIADKENFNSFIESINELRNNYNINDDHFYKKLKYQIENNESYFQNLN